MRVELRVELRAELSISNTVQFRIYPNKLQHKLNRCLT